ncbi:hypothetical protein Hanom_Chr03g00230401 [Helianthus anomalus]
MLIPCYALDFQNLLHVLILFCWFYDLILEKLFLLYDERKPINLSFQIKNGSSCLIEVSKKELVESYVDFDCI